jgi:hypothetical protein
VFILGDYVNQTLEKLKDNRRKYKMIKVELEKLWVNKTVRVPLLG